MKTRGFLVVIIALAFLSRVIAIGEPAFYYDEASHALRTGLILEGNSTWQIMAHYPPLSLWINAISALLLGINEFSLRLVAAIFGTLTVILVFFLAKRWYTTKEAILASTLIAILPLHVIFSRFAFVDVVATFFIVFAIYLVEQKKHFVLSGIVFGMAFLTKYSTLLLWLLYWAYIFSHKLFEDKKSKGYYKEKLSSFVLTNLASFTVVILSTGFKFVNLFYLAYGVVYSAIIQTVSGYDTPLFLLIALFDSLSPLLYACTLLSFIYLLAFDRERRSTKLLLFLNLSFLVIAVLQARTSLRHLVIITPFLVIVLARFLTLVLQSKKIKRSLAFAVFALIISSAAAWTFYEVSVDMDYTVWREVGIFLDTYPDVAVYSIYPNFPLSIRLPNSTDISYYTNKKTYSKPDPLEFKEGDLIVMANFSEKNFYTYQEPMKNNLLFYRIKAIEPYPIIANFVENNGKLIKIFYCEEKPCLFVYELGYIDNETKESLAQEEWSLFPIEKKQEFFEMSCDRLKKFHLDKITSILPPNLSNQINEKCSKVKNV